MAKDRLVCDKNEPLFCPLLQSANCQCQARLIDYIFANTRFITNAATCQMPPDLGGTHENRAR